MSYVDPAHQGIFQLKANGANWDVVDTRTSPPTVTATTNVALSVAQADAITRNKALNPLG